jgi:hypothetical protein
MLLNCYMRMVHIDEKMVYIDNISYFCFRDKLNGVCPFLKCCLYKNRFIPVPDLCSVCH